jgi:hypothetical protein
MTFVAMNGSPINRILDALGLNHVRSMTINARAGEVVSVVTEQFIQSDQIEKVACELETKEWVLVPKTGLLTDAEREAIEFFADIHADDDPPNEYAVILGKLLARLA